MGLQMAVFVVAGAVLFDFLYLGGRLFRRFWAWATGETGPKEKISVFLVIFAVMGGIAGGFAQPVYCMATNCSEQGKTVVSCLLSTRP